MTAAGSLRRMRPGRSFWLKLLVAGLLLLSISGWLRLQQSLEGWSDFIALGLQPGPLYLAVTGGVIGAGGLAAAIGVWLRSRLAFVFTRIFVLVWQAWTWADRLWLARSETAMSGWPFALGASALVLIYVFAVLDEEGRRLNEFKRSGNRS